MGEAIYSEVEDDQVCFSSFSGFSSPNVMSILITEFSSSFDSAVTTTLATSNVCTTIIKFTQLRNKFPPTALLNFACDG